MTVEDLETEDALDDQRSVLTVDALDDQRAYSVVVQAIEGWLHGQYDIARSGFNTNASFGTTGGITDWQNSYSGESLGSRALYIDGELYYANTDYTVYIIGTDGSQVDSLTLDETGGGEIDSSDGSFYLANDDILYSFDVASRTRNWKTTVPIGGYTVRDILSTAESVYLLDNDANVYAVDPADGSVQWSVTVDTIVGTDVGLAKTDDLLISLDRNTGVTAYDPGDGSEAWTYTYPGSESLADAPVTVGSGTYVFTTRDASVDPDEMRLRALDVSDGSLVWGEIYATQSGSAVPETGGLSTDGTNVYYGYDEPVGDGYYEARSLSDGSLVYQNDSISSRPYGYPVVLSNDITLWPAYNGKVKALDASGNQLWSWSGNDDGSTGGSATIREAICVGSDEIYALFGPSGSSITFHAFRVVEGLPAPSTYRDGPAHGEGERAFNGAATLNDGRVVFAPMYSANVGLYDPASGTYSSGPTHNETSTDAFTGVALAADGRAIFVPNESTNVGIFDPSDDSYTTGAHHGSTSGAAEYYRGVRVPDGRIVFTPHVSSTIGLYDPSSDTFTDGPAHGEGGTPFKGAALTGDGRVVFAPSDSANVGIFDPSDDSYTSGPAHGSGTAGEMFGGAALADDGRVVFAPRYASNVGIFDPSDDSYTTGPAHGESSTPTFGGAVTTAGGKVVFAPVSSNNIGVFDPSDDSYTSVSAFSFASFEFFGGALTDDNDVVFAPYESGNVGLYE